MQRQLCSPVKWYDAMRQLIAQEVDTFVEVGPGRVLVGLLKKTLPTDYPAKIFNVSNMKQLDTFFKETA
jgi:[acyl-carrier-protein] S-malonyltransferase